jgi:protein-S-isoprenylcysteine O-methyltransferase Ste14
MKDKVKAYTFVVVQFACLIFIFMSGPFLADSINGLLVEIAGLVLGVSAILQMRPGNFNIAPLPKNGGELITTGVYSVIRHPMYLAQLLVVGALTVDYYTLPRLLAVIILFVDLVLKLRFEEKQLHNQFDEYEEYARKSWKLIPYIY